jgi:uncharacterized YccA/Bax inhibitor family protein
MRTANPALNDSTFTRVMVAPDAARMTLTGTVHRTGILLLVLTFSATWTWNRVAAGEIVQFGLWIGGAAMIGLVIALITVFRPTVAPWSTPLYALAEGVLLGGISAVLERQFPGIVMQAVGITFGTLFALLAAYRSGLIRATENFKLGVVAATGGIFVLYLFSWILGMFGVSMPFLHDSGPIGILVSLFIVVVAALNLVLDFDFIERGAESGAPKYMEWYAAFGLLVTLIWLYLEVLRLLTKLNSRR